MRGVLAAALLWGGCADAALADCSVRCGQAGLCPAEMTCMNGFCLRAGGPTCGEVPAVDAWVDGNAASDGIASVDGAGDAQPAIYRDCLEARQLGMAVDGILTIDPDGAGSGSSPLQAFCDQTTAGGGWTLVYAYTFTDYENFSGFGNAVTPRPTWPFTSSGSSSPTSTTVPLSRTDLGALDFLRWRELGGEFLVTSN